MSWQLHAAKLIKKIKRNIMKMIDPNFERNGMVKLKGLQFQRAPTLFPAAEVEGERTETEKLLLSLSVLMSGCCLILRKSYIVEIEGGISHFV
jgi:hypothetical protein